MVRQSRTFEGIEPQVENDIVITRRVVAKLAAAGQDHLLQFAGDLPAAQRMALLEKIQSLDFPLLKRLHAEKGATVDTAALERAQPPADFVPATISTDDPEAYARAVETGRSLLREGKVGVLLAAGGEGTRLGFEHPKGMFPVGPVTGAPLFQWFCEQIQAVSEQAGRAIPYYVMTSCANHAEIEQFFTEHNYFGLDPQNVYFFPQGNMPVVDHQTGKVLMAARDRICESPDGHGGLLQALRKHGLFDDMRERGIEHLFYHQVDNPLVRICDPAFLGFHVLNGADVSTKVVEKKDPAEKVGLLVDVDGRPQMVEYSDLPAEAAARRAEDDRLLLRCGNIAVHVFDRELLERAAEGDGLPFHHAIKKVPFVNEQGELIKPESNNARKFERFIFDILSFARHSLAVEVLRDEEFAPLKDKEGPCSPEAVKHNLQRLHTRWLRDAGITQAEELPVEIPPRLALNEEEFLERLRAQSEPPADAP